MACMLLIILNSSAAEAMLIPSTVIPSMAIVLHNATQPCIVSWNDIERTDELVSFSNEPKLSISRRLILLPSTRLHTVTGRLRNRSVQYGSKLPSALYDLNSVNLCLPSMMTTGELIRFSSIPISPSPMYTTDITPIAGTNFAFLNFVSRL